MRNLYNVTVNLEQAQELCNWGFPQKSTYFALTDQDFLARNNEINFSALGKHRWAAPTLHELIEWVYPKVKSFSLSKEPFNPKAGAWVVQGESSGGFHVWHGDNPIDTLFGFIRLIKETP